MITEYEIENIDTNKELRMIHIQKTAGHTISKYLHGHKFKNLGHKCVHNKLVFVPGKEQSPTGVLPPRMPVIIQKDVTFFCMYKKPI